MTSIDQEARPLETPSVLVIPAARKNLNPIVKQVLLNFPPLSLVFEIEVLNLELENSENY